VTAEHLVYAYEVVDSSLPSVEVGSFLIDKTHPEDDVLLRSWTLWNATTGVMSVGMRGERRERACTECYVDHKVVRAHGHGMEHGPGPHLRPTRCGRLFSEPLGRPVDDAVRAAWGAGS
jgi:hypothetical protein